VTWAEYWNGETTVYVNARHRRVHYERVAHDVLRYLPGPAARIVDYGCGEALSADRVAEACAHLALCDSAPKVRERLAQRYAGRDDIGVIAPEEFEGLPAGTVDMILVNSVVQYLSDAELARLLAVARDKLAPGGRLVLADVIPRHVGPLRDAAELLEFARANGFLVSAVAGLVRSYFSSYRRNREQFGLLRFEEDEIIALLQQAGFAAQRAHPNIGHNTRRMTVLAVPVSAEAAVAAPVPREDGARQPLQAVSQG
jgi:SAM-dependent methyltransferase